MSDERDDASVEVDMEESEYSESAVASVQRELWEQNSRFVYDFYACATMDNDNQVLTAQWLQCDSKVEDTDYHQSYLAYNRWNNISIDRVFVPDVVDADIADFQEKCFTEKGDPWKHLYEFAVAKGHQHSSYKQTVANIVCPGNVLRLETCPHNAAVMAVKMSPNLLCLYDLSTQKNKPLNVMSDEDLLDLQSKSLDSLTEKVSKPDMQLLGHAEKDLSTDKDDEESSYGGAGFAMTWSRAAAYQGYLASGGYDGKVLVYALTPGMQHARKMEASWSLSLSAADRADALVNDISWHASEPYLAVTTETPNMNVYDIRIAGSSSSSSPAIVVNNAYGGADALGASVSFNPNPDLAHQLVTGSNNRRVCVWDIRTTKTPTDMFDAGNESEQIMQLSFAPNYAVNPNVLAVAGNRGSVSVYKLDSIKAPDDAKVIMHPCKGSQLSQIHWASDGSYTFVTTSSQGSDTFAEYFVECFTVSSSVVL